MSSHMCGTDCLVFGVATSPFSPQHGETALHLVAKYDHASVIALFAAFKVPMNARGKVRYFHVPSVV